MSNRVGPEVRGDAELARYANRLWSSQEYQTWRAHMEQDVADTLGGPSKRETPEDHSAEA